MNRIETIIVIGENGEPVMINLSDYDPATHELAPGQIAPVAPATTPEPPVAPATTPEPPVAPVAPVRLVAPNGKTGKAQRFNIVDGSGIVIGATDFATEGEAWAAIMADANKE